MLNSGGGAGESFSIGGGGDGEGDPRAGVAAFTDGVVEEAGVAAEGNSAAGGAEIGLGGGGILRVAQMIAGVGEQFDECDLNVGGIAVANTVVGGDASGAGTLMTWRDKSSTSSI